MNAKRLLLQVLLSLMVLSSMIFVSSCNDNSPLPWETPPAFTQSDLTGTWYVHKIKAGVNGQWLHFTATVDSSGNITLSSCVNSGDGEVTCPTDAVKWTMDSNGVVTESGPGAFEDVHITMTSGKNFMAGTATGGTETYQLLIAQKAEEGTTYSDYDIKSRSFVYHAFYSGEYNFWMHGEGATDSEGKFVLLSMILPWGSLGPQDLTDWSLSVDSNGIVTGLYDLHGFLSADKKTLVGTMVYNLASNTYGLIVIQMPNESSSVSQITGISFGHLLGTTSSMTDLFWAHASLNITNGGIVTFSDWISSDAATVPPANATLVIGPMGEATLAGNSDYETSFHGHLSYDGDFLVATMTYANTYLMIVTTK